MDKERREKLLRLESKINVAFKDKNFLNQALTHSSFVYESEDKTIKQNERLEFLGDAVLSLVVSEYLYGLYPDRMEGQLAKMRAVVVSKTVLSKIAKSINLGEYLLLGKGEEMTGGRVRDSILANAFEAIIGAIYLDRGLNDARVFILRYLKEEIGRVDRDESIKDNKTLLQEYTQEKFKILPEYKVVKVEGPDHLQTFKVNVMVKSKVFGTGEGRSKKEAEQDAASQALKRLKGGRS